MANWYLQALFPAVSFRNVTLQAMATGRLFEPFAMLHVGMFIAMVSVPTNHWPVGFLAKDDPMISRMAMAGTYP